MTWTIRCADGQDVTLRTSLFPLHGGEFSYRLDVPHSALASGLSASSDTVPLRAMEEIHQHFRIAVEGLPARILTPNGQMFNADQALRTATYRLDLEVALVPVDSDGDGIPDWWEEKFNTDDPNGDLDGDGLNNLAEFRNGTDPQHDDRVPSLATHELHVYAEGRTIVLLRAIDADSASANLQYTLLQLPDNGTLIRRDAAPAQADPDASLAVNATFTQAEVNQGQIVFVHNGTTSTASFSSLTVALQDEDPAHPASTNRVQVLVYRPAPSLSAPELDVAATDLPHRLIDLPGRPSAELPRLNSYLLGRDWGFVICDASIETTHQDLAAPSSALSAAEYASQYVPEFGHDRRHIMQGSLADDHLAGSMEDDILIGGRGNDILRGNAGGDLFVFFAADDGNDTIEDFSVAENDALDFSRVLTGTSPNLTNYLQVAAAGSNTLLKLNFAGAGAGYTNMVLTLAGIQLTTADLYALADNGQLLTGDKGLPARLSIVATQPNASENGPVNGEFEITRSGSTVVNLTVNLHLTGSAANGADYEFINPQITIPAGARSATVRIAPYVDALTELSEVVDLGLLPGTGYELGATTTARVTIEDLAPQISLEAMEPYAVKTSQSPGLFLVSRSGVLDRSVLVRLQIGGTAVNGVDYARINSYVNLPAGQTATIIEINPIQLALFPDGAKTVSVSVKPDAAYRLNPPTSARVMIVEEMLTLAQWRAQHFPAYLGSLSAFAADDPGKQGISNLERYAYGLDPDHPDRAHLPKAVIRDGYLTLDVWRRPEATDVEFVVEVSSDLDSWNSTPASIEELPSDDSASDSGLQCYRALPGVQAAQKLFMRIRILNTP